jgi:hypothetical protein
MTCSCWALADGGAGCGLVERGGGGGCTCATIVTVPSHSTSGFGLGLERRLVVWCLLYLMTSLLYASFFSSSFLALSFKHAPCSPGPSLSNLHDMALLLFNAGFQRLLNGGMKNGEAELKQLLSKTGMSHFIFILVVVENKKKIINDCFEMCSIASVSAMAGSHGSVDFWCCQFLMTWCNLLSWLFSSFFGVVVVAPSWLGVSGGQIHTHHQIVR